MIEAVLSFFFYLSPVSVLFGARTSSSHTSKGTEEARGQESEKEEGKGKRKTEESGNSSLVSF